MQSLVQLQETLLVVAMPVLETTLREPSCYTCMQTKMNWFTRVSLMILHC